MLIFSNEIRVQGHESLGYFRANSVIAEMLGMKELTDGGDDKVQASCLDLIQNIT